jgi:predicted dehydrogenase
VHHFDLWRYLTGAEVEEISATIRSGSGDDESAAVTACMHNGLIATSVFSNQTSECNELEVYGSKGAIRVSCYQFDGLKLTPALHDSGSLRNLPSRISTTLKEIPGAVARAAHGGDFRSSYEAQWRHLADSIRNDTPVECTLEDGRRAVQASLAAMTSALESRPVRTAELRCESLL